MKKDDFYTQVRKTSDELEILSQMLDNIPKRFYADMIMEINTFSVSPYSVRHFEKEIHAVSRGLKKYTEWLKATES
jgi:hypothetical protein